MTKLVLPALICVHLRLIALPIWFEPNQGQAHPSVEFLARTSQGYMYLGRNQMAVHVNGRPVRMSLEDANSRTASILEEPLDAISSYFSGQTEKDWHTGIPHYARVRYKDVYPGIDLVYYASGGNLEYDFRLQPNADPSRIKLAYSQPVSTNANGDLLVGGLRQKRPKVYQNGLEIACDYLVRDAHHVQLALATYDKSQQLAVDPVLVFSTFLGGPGDDSDAGIALDSSGFIYLGMSTQSPAAPVLNPFQQESIESLQPAVFKLTPDGQQIVYYAILNSLGWDWANGVTVDSTGSPILVGATQSARFPLKNPVQATFNSSYWTTFITKFTPDGRSLIFSTYYGGSYWDQMGGVAVDQQGNTYITGSTQSRDLLVKNAVQPRSGGGGLDCFIGKLSPTGDLLFSTYYGGSAWEFCSSVAIAPDGGVLVAGGSQSADYPFKNPIQTERTPKSQYETPTMLKLSSDGQTVIFATYFGGPTYGDASAVKTDSAGNIYTVGSCGDHLTVKNAYQGTDPGAYYNVFLAKYDSTMQNLIFATYFAGSSGYDNNAYDVAIDSTGNIFIAGQADSADFPQKNSLQPFRGGGTFNTDGFVAKFDPSGGLIYSTFLGGRDEDWAGRIALDSKGDVYVFGTTYSTDFPVKNAFQPSHGGGRDAFLVEIFDDTVLSSPVKVTPGSVTFEYVQGGAKPQPQTVAVNGPTFKLSLSGQWFYAEEPMLGTITVAVFPDGLNPGTYNGIVTLTPQTGDPATIAVTFTVLAPAPVLTSITPSVIPIGSDATTVALHGSGFTNHTSILLGVTTWDIPVTFVNSETLQVTLPKADLIVQATLPLSVQNPQSAVSSVVSLTIGQPGPQVAANGVVNAASFAPGPVAPGEIVSIFGANLDKNVTFDSIPATLVYFSPTQVNVTVPYQISGQTTTQLVVGQFAVSAAPVTLNVAPAAPGIFAAVPVGKNIVTLYATGCGLLTTDALPRCMLPVSVTANGQTAQVMYAGIAPGLAQGVDQINFQLPDGVTSGNISIVVTAGNATSKPFVLALQ